MARKPMIELDRGKTAKALERMASTPSITVMAGLSLAHGATEDVIRRAAYVEHGTIHMEANPFMRRAMALHSRERNDRVREIAFASAIDPRRAESLADSLALQMANDIREEAPVDTGELRDSITGWTSTTRRS